MGRGHFVIGGNTLGRIRTCDLRFRKPLLYPLSYEGTHKNTDYSEQLRRSLYYLMHYWRLKLATSR